MRSKSAIRNLPPAEPGSAIPRHAWLTQRAVQSWAAMAISRHAVDQCKGSRLNGPLADLDTLTMRVSLGPERAVVFHAPAHHLIP
jgi:hypothetical protein